jgi:hypothetical protein
MARTPRSSSLVENLNSRLRNYFTLRRHLEDSYLGLLQFFLNHRRFMRSRRAERNGKSPCELMTGQGHPHWLTLLGLGLPQPLRACLGEGWPPPKQNTPRSGSQAGGFRTPVVTQNWQILNHAHTSPPTTSWKGRNSTTLMPAPRPSGACRLRPSTRTWHVTSRRWTTLSPRMPHLSVKHCASGKSPTICARSVPKPKRRRGRLKMRAPSRRVVLRRELRSARRGHSSTGSVDQTARCPISAPNTSDVWASSLCRSVALFGSAQADHPSTSWCLAQPVVGLAERRRPLSTRSKLGPSSRLA